VTVSIIVSKHSNICINGTFCVLFCLQALQAPACHENMVKVGGYILGEFGNLIAGDPRSGCGLAFCFLHIACNCKHTLMKTTLMMIQLLILCHCHACLCF